MLAIRSLVPLAHWSLAYISGSSCTIAEDFMHFWSLAWGILSTTFLTCEMSAIVWYFEHSVALPFFGIGMKTDLFQSRGHCWVFQICWHNECSSFTTSSFRICDFMDFSTPGFPVLYCFPEFAEIHVHWVGDAMQPSPFPTSGSFT